MSEKTINREAGDKTKGFTLQKQRALSLFFDEIKLKPDCFVNVAIEYQGDVYLQNEKKGYIEEQKNYDEKTAFSFNSSQILNTVVYFLDIWLSEKKSKNIQFGFYTTNKIANENSTDKTKRLKIKLPKEGILNLLKQRKHDDLLLIESVQKIISYEYKEQYDKDISSQLDKTSLIDFLNTISWFFEQKDEKNIEKELLDKIKKSEFAGHLNNDYQPNFVYASLMLALEKKQDEKDFKLKFLNKDSVENIFLKISSGKTINTRTYKYLNFDYNELKKKTYIWLESFLKSKYFSNVKNKKFPVLLERKVARHNREVKIERKNLEQTNPKKASHLEVVIGGLGDLINDVRPTFLFGEIGSGKSTLLAHHHLNEIENSTLPIFITTTYLKGKISPDIKAFKTIINEFVNNELNLDDKFFDLDKIHLTKKEITLIIDGLDELDQIEAQKLIQHLLIISANSTNIRIIASGRPLELQELVNFNDWNCLTTLDLTEIEIKQLLKNEAIAVGMNNADAEIDAITKLKILQTKQELLSNSTTPLIVCLIRDFLDENLSTKTLGDILYEVVKRRLNWHKDDNKVNLKTFLDAYPNIFQREIFIAQIADKLYRSSDGKINEESLFQIINSEILIPKNISNRNKVVNEAIAFFKGNFLQKIGDNYAFQSHQLYQVAIGLNIYNQVSSGIEFDFKQDRIDEWREISYASTIARNKENSNEIIKFLAGFVQEMLFTKTNTPATAVLLGEAQISDLNTIFLEKLENIGFRPLKFWGASDSLVPHAYAYILKDLGKRGFMWFYENYLNPKHPMQTGHDEMSVLILRYYLILHEFKLPVYCNELLEKIIPVNIATQTYMCNTLLPTIALAIPNKFVKEDRSILLAEVLKNNVVSTKAQDLLRHEWKIGNSSEVINGLEVACRNKDYRPQNAIRLWLEMVDKPIPKLILDNCIQLIAKGNEELQPILELKIGKSNLISYLRFCSLHLNSISDSASILLYQFDGERNPKLIGQPIMQKTSLLDYKDRIREEILNEIIYQGKIGEEFIINNMPLPVRDLGISELYLKYFLTTLNNSSSIYINEFLHVVKNLSKYCLSRYPGIRGKFMKLLNKDPYYEVLKKAMSGLDAVLRYKSASILLACHPESEKDALEIVIKSSFKKHSNNQEWLRFCMKLNYSVNILDFIHELLDDLTEVSRIFALKLLYHNDEYKLNDKLLNELITGLLGDGYFLDWSGTLSDDGITRVIGHERFFKIILNALGSEIYETKRVAASNLISHHYERLSTDEKAICWLFDIQYSEHALMEFEEKYIKLFDNDDFVKAILKYSKKFKSILNGKDFLFLKYFKAIKRNGSWKDFFLTLFNIDRHLDVHKIEHMYSFFIQAAHTSPDTRRKMGLAIKEIMYYPVYSQDRHHNFVFWQLANLASEFGAINESEIRDIFENYKITAEGFACALLFRLGEIPETFSSKRKIEHISLFASNPVSFFPKINKGNLEVLLESGEDIPNDLVTAFESVLLNNFISSEDLIQLSKKSNLAKYFAIVTAFCRKSNVIVDDFITAEEIGGSKYFARGRTIKHKSILFRLRDVYISDKKGKELYVASLLAAIDSYGTKSDSSNLIDLFKELLALRIKFKANLVVVLFDKLLDVPYRLDLNLVYEINQFILSETDENERKNLVIPLKKILNSINSFGSSRHENEFELLGWTISLILIFIEKTSDMVTERGFLIGLRNVFIQNSRNNYIGDDGKEMRFKGGDLFTHSNLIFNKIDNKIIRNILVKGIDSNIPEISAVCKLISAFSLQ